MNFGHFAIKEDQRMANSTEVERFREQRFFEGWDEALPVRFGKADAMLGGVFIEDFSALALYLRDRQKIMRFSTIWQDILDLD